MIHRNFALILALVSLCGTASAQQTILTSRMLQDEAQELPADNTAFFTAARQVSIQLDMLAAVDNEFDDALVSVVSLDGETRNYEPDQNGRVTLTNVTEGPHAIVASGKAAHGTTLLYFEEQEPEAKRETTAPTKMTLVALDSPETLRPFVNDLSDLRGSSGDVRRSTKTGPIFGYRVAVQPDGTMLGRVYSVLQLPTEESTGIVSGPLVKGTRVTILKGGQTVATAIADETGAFRVSGMRTGVYGCVAVGRAGYAAFAFEAVGSTEVVSKNNRDERFVSTLQESDPQPGLTDELPVILIPPALVPAVLDAIREYYPELASYIDSSAIASGQPLASPYGGGFAGSGYGGGGGGGGGFGGGGLGGLLGALGLGAAAAGGGGSGGVFIPPPPASPAVP